MDQALPHKRKERGTSFLRATLYALLISLITLILMLLLSSAIAMKSQNPSALIPPLGNGCALACAFLCGFIGARLRGRQGLLIGAASGLGYLLLFLVGLLALAGDGNLEMGMILFSYLIFFALSLLGGVLGTVKRQRKKHRGRRH